jgi:hypothetical protein
MRSILIVISGLALAPTGCSNTSSGFPDGGASGPSVSSTYNCMDSIVLMFTKPTGYGTQKGAVSATYIVVDNNDGTATISLEGPDGGAPCTTHFSLSGTMGTLLPNQVCESVSPGSDLHFNYTSGAVNLSSGSNTYAFGFTGMVTGDAGVVQVAGTGTDSQMCTKQ